jgi:hypothetical protein
MAYGAHAGREVADLIGQIWHCLAPLLFLVELRWSELEMRRWREAKISINKAVLGGSGGLMCSGSPLLLPRRGDERKKFLLVVFRWPLHLQQRRLASSRRIYTAPLSPDLMAGRQPLLPCMVATCRLQDPRRNSTAPLPPYPTAEGRPLLPRATTTSRPLSSNFLRQAFVPTRRFFKLDGVGSHRCAPSGFVPGGTEVDSDELCSGEAGAGPDRFFQFLLEVLTVISKGLLVISYFLLALPVICISTADELKP